MNHIMVVDDDAAVRRLSTLVLVEAGYEVTSAENGAVALSSIEEDLPGVIVLDLNMPVMDGWTLFQRLMSLPLRPPVILCSALNVAAARKQLGAERGIEKPFDPDELVAVVGSLLPPVRG